MCLRLLGIKPLHQAFRSVHQKHLSVVLHPLLEAGHPLGFPRCLQVTHAAPRISNATRLRCSSVRRHRRHRRRSAASVLKLAARQWRGTAWRRQRRSQHEVGRSWGWRWLVVESGPQKTIRLGFIMLSHSQVDHIVQ